MYSKSKTSKFLASLTSLALTASMSTLSGFAAPSAGECSLDLSKSSAGECSLDLSKSSNGECSLDLSKSSNGECSLDLPGSSNGECSLGLPEAAVVNNAHQTADTIISAAKEYAGLVGDLELYSHEKPWQRYLSEISLVDRIYMIKPGIDINPAAAHAASYDALQQQTNALQQQTNALQQQADTLREKIDQLLNDAKINLTEDELTIVQENLSEYLDVLKKEYDKYEMNYTTSLADEKKNFAAASTAAHTVFYTSKSYRSVCTAYCKTHRVSLSSLSLDDLFGCAIENNMLFREWADAMNKLRNSKLRLKEIEKLGNISYKVLTAVQNAFGLSSVSGVYTDDEPTTSQTTTTTTTTTATQA